MSLRDCYGKDEGDDVDTVCDASAHYTALDGYRLCSRHALRAVAEGDAVTPDEGWPSINEETPTT